MKQLHSNYHSLLITAVLLGSLHLPLHSTGEEDNGFQLIAHTFSAGVPTTDGDIMLTACSIGGLYVGTSEDGVFSIQGGDLIPLTEAGPLFLQSVVSADELRFSWDATGSVLERTDSLWPPITWINVTGGDSGYMVLPLSGTRGFFRLRCDIARP